MSLELFKEGIKKFWIVPLILTIILAITVPMYTISQKASIEQGVTVFEQIDTSAESVAENIDANIAGLYKELTTGNLIYNPYTMFVILILPIVLGVQLFGNSKKGKNRLADFIKEKGLSKEVVYKTNLVTGVVLSIMPIVISTILLLIIKLFAGMGDYITAKLLVSWAVLGILSSIIFFVVAVLIGFITKSKSTQVLYTYGILFIPVFLVYLLETVLTRVIYGFPGFSMGIFEFLNQVPSIKVCQMFVGNNINYLVTHSLNLWYALVYAIIIAILVFIGYKLLNVKNQEKMQTVGDKIFKYIWIYILGAFTYIALMLNFNNVFISILVTVGLFLIVYMLKEIISKKSFKAILNGKSYYIISMITVGIIILLSSNMFGYETKSPDASEVEYMTYTLAYPYETDEIQFKTEENIKYLIDKHQKFILEKNDIKDISSEELARVYLQYKLKNGKSIIRSYETELTLDESIFRTEEYIKQKYAYMYEDSEKIDILKIAGIYKDSQFIFEANRYDNLEMLNEIVDCISKDLINHNVHVLTTGEYQQYSNDEDIEFLQVALLDGMNQYTSYVYYLKIDEKYELVKKIQELIEDESEFISWQE